MKPEADIENLGEKFPWVSFLLTAAFFLLFAIILSVIYIPGRHSFNVNQERIDERMAILADTHAKAQKSLEGYEWVDPSKQLVRVPVEDAMKVIVEKQEVITKPAKK